MSSCNDCIKFSLNIKDPLLEFLDISTGKYRNREAKFYHAIVHLDHCLNCGSDNIVHNGHLYSNVRYPALDASLPVFIRIAKERIICRNCQTNSMAQTELVDKYCCISNATKRKIIGSLTEDWSMKSIARQTSTSTNTVQRVLEKYSPSSFEDTDWLPLQPHFYYILPSVLQPKVNNRQRSLWLSDTSSTIRLRFFRLRSQCQRFLPA